MSEYIREFNQVIRGNYKNVSEETLKYLGIIATTSDFLKLETPEVSTFFVNLHCILGDTNNQSIINHCFTILEQAVKQKRLKEALINDYKFLPVLAQLLYRFTGENTRVLELLEEMTYDIRFSQQEFYLDLLMKHLIEMIKKQSDSSGAAFAVLINLCFKNEECMYLVLRLIKLKELVKLVDSFGIYTWKFYLIFDYKPDPRMISQQMKLSSDVIESALNEFDLVRLRHIVDFITSANRLAGGQEFDKALKQQIIDKLMTTWESEIVTNNEANREQKLKCIPLLFILIEEILMTGNNDKEYVTSLVDVCLKWLCTTSIGAMKVLSLVFQQPGLEINEQALSGLETQIPLLITRIEEKKMSADELIVFFEMLLSMIKCPITQTKIVNLIMETFLEGIIQDIASRFDSGFKTGETSSNLRLFVYVLNVLYELSNTDTQKYYSTFRSLMQNHMTQKLLAKAFVVRDTKSYQMIFRMSRTSEFPLEEVSQLLANQSFVCTDQCFNEPSKTNKVIIAPPTVELENRLDEILLKLSKYPQENLLTSEIIEAYKYNIYSHLKKNEHLTMRLENAESTITRLSHETQLLNSQISKYQQDNFAKLLNYEAITKENQVMQGELNILRTSMQQFNHSYDVAKKRNIQLKASLEEKEIKLQKVVEELERATEKLTKTESQLQELSKESKRRTDEFKQHFKTYENKLKTCQKECESLSSSVKELEKQNVHLNDFVKSLEKQIIVKDEQIKTYKDELQECDQMRQMIANVVSKRQKK